MTILVCFLSAHLIFGQFSVKPLFFETTGVSNQGVVVGYEGQAGPYSIWKPDSGITSYIGGLAPGLGVGGQARFSDDGNYLSGTSHVLNGAEMSRYDVSTNQWLPLGNLGFAIDSTLSGGFGISGDGNTVVGNSWADTTGGFAYTHAVAWNQTEGFLDLGSMFSSAGISARANNLSSDGSIVVGWQDFNGPWKSAVWRKNPGGGYFPNEYLLIDTNGSPTDEYNQLGECSVVSADGNWIGGYGDYANNNEPWIWSQDSGVINLGILPGGMQGFVSGMNPDASVVVGWFDGGFGDPRLPFIWTPTGGLENLNTYINTVLGYSTSGYQIYTANCMSANGQYVAGYGVDSAFNYFAYRVNLDPNVGIYNLSGTNKISIYPNPTSNSITIKNSNKSILTISNMGGMVIESMEIYGNHILDISKYAQGVYVLTVQSGDSIRTGKFIKN